MGACEKGRKVQTNLNNLHNHLNKILHISISVFPALLQYPYARRYLLLICAQNKLHLDAF